MAASDNVLRGGLTSKAIDKEELERVVVFEPSTPDYLTALETSDGERIFAPPVPDFRLGVLEGANRTFRRGPVHSPWIVIAAKGTVDLIQGEESLSLRKGESAVILPGPEVTLTVCGLMYRAWSEI